MNAAHILYNHLVWLVVWLSICAAANAEELLDRTVLDGSTVTFQCHTPRGDMTKSKNIHWFHDGEKMARRNSSWRVLSRGALKIQPVQKSLSGSYYCERNDERSKTYTLNVHVEARLTTAPEDMRVEWGSHVTLECKAQGFPSPHIHWLKNNNPIIDPETELVYSKEELQVNVTEHAQYSCVAENTVITGRTSDSKTVHITYIEDTRPRETCAAYSGSVCSEYLPAGAMIYSARALTNVTSEALAASLLQTVTKKGVDSTCSRVLESVLCLTVFPRCDDDSGGHLAKPMPICREKCERLHEMCSSQQDFQMILETLPDIYNSSVFGGCETLPSKAEEPCDDTLKLPAPPIDAPERSHEDLCFEEHGATYAGSVNITDAGVACQAWNTQSPHKHNYTAHNYPQQLSRAGNACRNPGGVRNRPWCFTQNPQTLWQYCGISKCGALISPMRSTEESRSSHLLLSYGLGISVVALLAIIISLIIIITCRSRDKKTRSSGFNDYLVTPTSDMDLDLKLPQNDCYHQRLSSVSSSIKLERYEYPRNDIVFLKDIGEGAFGRVFTAKVPLLSNKSDEQEEAVVKLLRDDASMTLKEGFLKEADLLCEFEHENIVQLLGVCTIGRPMCIILEYLQNGELKQFLKERNPENVAIYQKLITNNNKERADNFQSLSKADLIYISKQITSAMVYLTKKGYVHRDLATRNCLVGSDLCVKVADFGLARHLQGQTVYRAAEEEPIPIRWLSLEAILHNQFTHESDVWSFGVLLWEVFSFGMQPYYGQTHQEVLDSLQAGHMLTCPANTPSEVYELMQMCWYKRPESRPTFTMLYKSLCSLHTFYNQM